MFRRCLHCVFLAVLFSLFFIAQSQECYAVPACNEAVEITQPDNSKFQLRQKGDEFFNYALSEKDNKVIIKDTDGYWKYAIEVSGRLIPSSAIVGKKPAPLNSIKGEDWAGKGIENVKSEPHFMIGQQLGTLPVTPLYGSSLSLEKVLVLMVEFNNVSIESSDTIWYDKFFGESGKTVKTFYKENSNNQFYFNPAEETYGTEYDGVVKVRLNYNHPNTGASVCDANRQIVKDALAAADSFVNYASFDTNGNGYLDYSELHVVTIIAGSETSYGGGFAPSVWAHRWSLGGAVSAPQLDGKYIGAAGYGGYTQQGEKHGTSLYDYHIATIGVLCHELGHDIGLPDLYNTNNDNQVAEVGANSVMASGNWGSASGEYSGTSPVHFDPWSKTELGFYTPTVMSSGTGSVYSALSNQYNIIRVNTSDPDEYFLIDNRQIEGFDAGLNYNSITIGGLGIWHIDNSIIRTYRGSNRINASGHLPGIWLEKNQKINSDPYWYGSRNTFYDLSDPNSKLNDGTASNVFLTASGSGRNMSVTIYDDFVTVGFESGNMEIEEDGGIAQVVITRTGNLNIACTVDYCTLDNTAHAGTDYTESNGTITFEAGEAQKILEIEILDDTIMKNDKQFVINLANPSIGALLNEFSDIIVTIKDNDGSIVFSEDAESESTLWQIEPAGKWIRTTQRVFEGSYSWKAVNENNAGYSLLSPAFSLRNNTSAALKYVTWYYLEYGFDYGYIQISTDGGTNWTTLRQYTGTSNDTWTDQWVDLSSYCGHDNLLIRFLYNSNGSNYWGWYVDNIALISDSEIPVITGLSSALVSSSSVELSWNTVNNIEGYNVYRSEEEQGDYVIIGNPDQSSYIDSGLTPLTQYWYKVSAFKNGVEGPQSAAIGITTLDPPTVDIGFEFSEVDASENSGTVEVNVIRSGNPEGSYSVNYYTQDITAIAGTDYTAAAGTLIFLTGEMSKVVAVDIVDNNQNNSNKTFNIIIDSPTNGAILGDFSETTVFIIDNECQGILSEDAESEATLWCAEPMGMWQRTKDRASQGAYSWKATNSNNAAYSFISPVFSLNNLTNAKMEYACYYNLESGYDYGNVEISTDGGASWQTIKTYNGYSNWMYDQIDLSSYCGLDNLKIRFMLTTDYSVLNEGWYIDEISLIAETAIAAPTGLVPVSITSDTVELSWNAVNSANSYNIYRADDDYGEYTLIGYTDSTTYVDINLMSDTSYWYKVSAVIDGAEGPQSESLSVITLNPPIIGFYETDCIVNEQEGSIQVQVTRSGDLSTAVSVEYSTLGGSANELQDYSPVSGTCSFEAGETNRTITIPIIDDCIYEPDETFFLNLYNPASGVELDENTQVTVTILQNDYMESTGTVVFLNLEGGLYGIMGDDGLKYRPIYQLGDIQAGDRVRYKWIEVEGEVSFQMWGKGIRILEMEVIGHINPLQNKNPGRPDISPPGIRQLPEIIPSPMVEPSPVIKPSPVVEPSPVIVIDPIRLPLGKNPRI